MADSNTLNMLRMMRNNQESSPESSPKSEDKGQEDRVLSLSSDEAKSLGLKQGDPATFYIEGSIESLDESGAKVQVTKVSKGAPDQANAIRRM